MNWADETEVLITGTCDFGECDQETVAVVECADGWLSMCAPHAIQELLVLETSNADNR